MATMPPLWLIQSMLKMGLSLPDVETTPLPENWAQMSGDQKYEFYINAYLSTEGRSFDSPEIEATYIRRAQRIVDVIALKEPDRVPNVFFAEGFPVHYSGLTEEDMWYRSNKSHKASLKVQEEFNTEYGLGALCIPYPGKAYDILGVKIAKWPGSQIPEQALRADQSHQYIEGEYMTADEYDTLIADPTLFFLTTYLPRICSNLSGLGDFPGFAGFTAMDYMMIFLMSYGMGGIKKSFDTLDKAAKQVLVDLMPYLLTAMKFESQYGVPSIYSTAGLAPFDIVGNTLRGTKGILTDMYRNPDKLVAACDAVTPMAIKMATSGVLAGRCPINLIPLHKGADGFMSTEQFEKFYWPSFRKLLMGIIDAGLIPMCHVQGSYNNRLDFIAEKGDLPAGKTMWFFDQTDMKAAKEKFGSWACIGGNVPSSLFMTATPDEMDQYCKELIEIAAPGGGYVMASGAFVGEAKVENVHTFLQSTKKYGVY